MGTILSIGSLHIPALPSPGIHRSYLIHHLYQPAHSRGPQEMLSFPPKNSLLARDESCHTERGRGFQENTRKILTIIEKYQVDGHKPRIQVLTPPFQESGNK